MDNCESRDHCEIKRDESSGRSYLKDSESSHGTFLNSEKIYAKWRELANGDVISIASCCAVVFQYCAEVHSEAVETLRSDGTAKDED
jgi:pSer/pThr/pTyr-binding forkhead associated (FHA) protein